MQAPEKYIFRLGMITAGNFIALNGFMVSGRLDSRGAVVWGAGGLEVAVTVE